MKIKLTVCSTLNMLLYVTLPRGRICLGSAGFLGREGYFWLTRVGCDVTSVSSSPGLGSDLAAEILLSLSCCSA